MMLNSRKRIISRMESGDAADAELHDEMPRPLQDANVKYELSSAAERTDRDALVAAWRDWIHYGMQSPGAMNMVEILHAVMESMDVFLNHAGGRRK